MHAPLAKIWYYVFESVHSTSYTGKIPTFKGVNKQNKCIYHPSKAFETPLYTFIHVFNKEVDTKENHITYVVLPRYLKNLLNNLRCLFLSNLIKVFTLRQQWQSFSIKTRAAWT